MNSLELVVYKIPNGNTTSFKVLIISPFTLNKLPKTPKIDTFEINLSRQIFNDFLIKKLNYEMLKKYL